MQPDILYGANILSQFYTASQNLYACKLEAKYLEEMEKMSNMEKQVVCIIITNMYVRVS